jgi:hypothetical protein
VQGFAQNFAANYSVQLRAALMSPNLAETLRNFFGDPAGGGVALLESVAQRLNYSQNLGEWKITLQKYFQGNFRYSLKAISEYFGSKNHMVPTSRPKFNFSPPQYSNISSSSGTLLYLYPPSPFCIYFTFIFHFLIFPPFFIFPHFHISP